MLLSRHVQGCGWAWLAPWPRSRKGPRSYMLVQNPMWLYRLYPTTWLHISPTEILVLVATDQLTCYNQLWHPMLLKYPCLGEIHMFLRPIAAAAQTLPPRLAAEDCLTGKVWTVCTWLLKFKAPLSGGKTFGMNLGTSRIFLRDFAWKIFRTHWKKRLVIVGVPSGFIIIHDPQTMYSKG